MEVLGENCKEFEEIKLVTIFKEYDGVVDEISNCDDEIVVILETIFVDEIKKSNQKESIDFLFHINQNYWNLYDMISVQLSGKNANFLYGSTELRLSIPFKTIKNQNLTASVIGYKYVNLGKMMDNIKAKMDPMEAIESASGTYGRFDEAVKTIDPREM